MKRYWKNSEEKSNVIPLNGGSPSMLELMEKKRARSLSGFEAFELINTLRDLAINSSDQETREAATISLSHLEADPERYCKPNGQRVAA